MPKILRDSMNNKEFDDIIKNRLESLNTNGSDDAWDLFKEKWEEETIHNDIDNDVQDEEFDAKIKQDLSGLRVPFNSKHWIILKEQLELEALFKKKLFVAKSVELVILAFLVIGILNLWPIQKEIYQIHFYDSPMVASVPVDKATAKKFEESEQVRLSEQKAFVNSARKAVRKALVPLVPLSMQSASESNSNIDSQKDEFYQKSINPINSIESERIKIPFIDNQNQSTRMNGPVTEEVNDSQQPIAQILETEILELNIPIRPIGFPDLVQVNKSSAKKGNTYLSFGIGPKVNLINSPFDPVYGFDPYNTINTNFNISAKVGKEIGPLEVYAGLGYTNTSYVPRLVDEIYEPLESQFNVASLENIEFKTINVPLGVKHNIYDSEVCQLYVAGGLDLNIIADSEYIIQDKPLGRSQPAPPPSPKNSVNENAKLSQKEFNKGVFSGGSLKDNLYATASVGFGLNWNVKENSGIFIEPRYSHFISSKGIGPNEDKVHGLSIDLGVRYKLN